MLTSILPPVVHGHNRGAVRRRWLRLALLHSLANIASATAVGGLLAVLAWGLRQAGWQPAPWACALGLGVALVYLPRQLGWIRFPPLLQSTRQVPRRWAYDYPRWATALLFGLGLGNGCYTRIVVPTFYLLFLWPFLTAGFFWPGLVWGSYGLARSLHVWWLACTAPPNCLLAHVNRLAVAMLGRAAWMHRTNALVLAVAAACLAYWGTRG